MKVCTACRSQLPDTYTACPNCGSTNLVMDQSMPQGQAVMPGQPMGGMQQPMPGPVVQPVNQSKGNFGWAVLGFLIPIVGWILWLVWKNTKPGDAKMAGIGGLIGFAVNLVLQLTVLK